MAYLGGKIDKTKVVFIAKILVITQDSALKIRKDVLQGETNMKTDHDTIIAMTVIGNTDRVRSPEVGIMIDIVMREIIEI